MKRNIVQLTRLRGNLLKNAKRIVLVRVRVCIQLSELFTLFSINFLELGVPDFDVTAVPARNIAGLEILPVSIINIGRLEPAILDQVGMGRVAAMEIAPTRRLLLTKLRLTFIVLPFRLGESN